MAQGLYFLGVTFDESPVVAHAKQVSDICDILWFWPLQYISPSHSLW